MASKSGGGWWRVVVQNEMQITGARPCFSDLYRLDPLVTFSLSGLFQRLATLAYLLSLGYPWSSFLACLSASVSYPPGSACVRCSPSA